MFRYTKLSLLVEILMIFVTILLLLPFWILLVTAFKSSQETLRTSSLAFPKAPTFDNFTTLLSPAGAQSGNIFAGLGASVLITAGTILLLVVFGSLTAYVLVRRTARWSNATYNVFVIAIILPTQLGTLPLYIEARSLGLVGNPFGMMLIYTGMLLPLAVFLYGNFVRRLPHDYEEAATIDGASPFQVFRRVVFPLLGPATGTVTILTGLIVWNDFFTSLIFLNGSAWQTLPVVMYNFVGSLVSQWNLIFAVVLISVIPILAFYVFAQRRFIQGFGGGVKG